MSEQKAIIETGGKQYSVKVGDRIRIEKLEAETGDSYTFDKVLLVESGDSAKIGSPLVAGASVSGKIIAQGKSPKVVVYKYKRRQGYRRNIGHRQPYTEVLIESMNA
jgi:large subunit ribosomal protein L21